MPKEEHIFSVAVLASARLFAGMLRRDGKNFSDEDEKTLALLLSALQEAQKAGSVCLGKERFESAAAAAAMPNAQLSEIVKKFEDCGLISFFNGKFLPKEAPLVADVGQADVRVYAERSFYEEARLAQKVMRLASIGTKATSPAKDESDKARRAAELALNEYFVVVSGGPGTGKTTIVTSILAGLLKKDSALRIVLAAPTGKAAGRMQQAVHEQAKKRFAESAVGAKLLSLQAGTIHRLLLTKQDDGSRPGPDTPLDCDVLVVDESSMVDMPLAMRLFEAIDESRTRVILLGDRHQLAAVGPGSVFADLSDLSGALAGNIEQLTFSHRFAADKAIGTLAAAINAGDDGNVLELLKDFTNREQDVHADNVVRWHRARAISEALTREAQSWIERMMKSIIEGIRAGQKGFAAGGQERLEAARSVAKVMRSFGALAAVRRGPMSVEAINREADAILCANGFEASRWRQIIVRSNDDVLGLYNGDVGVVVPAEDGGEEVLFLDSDRFVKLGLLPPFDEAFAITIHQSQGSEYHHAAVFLPVDENSPLAARELLYTAVTRVSDEREKGSSKKRFGTLDIFGSAPVVRKSVKTRVMREGGLAARLGQVGSLPQIN